MSQLPPEVHFEVLDHLLWAQQPLLHSNLCAARKYAFSSIDHARIMTEYFRHERNKRRLLDIPNQSQIWDGWLDANRYAQTPTAALGTGPEPDVLTGVIYSNCIPCFHLLRDHIHFPFDRYNDFGYSFLGLALLLGHHEIARGIANRINNQGHITGRANVKLTGGQGQKIITLAAQTGDRLIFEPILDQIQPDLVDYYIRLTVGKHERAHLCRDSTVALAHQLLEDRCNIADGVDSNSQDTSWHYGVENPHGTEFMKFLFCNRTPQVRLDQPNANGETPLMKAVRSGSLDIVRWLIDICADVEYEGARGTTAAHLAAELQINESITMLEILLPHAQINSGHQTAAGTIFHALVDGVRSAEGELSNNTTLGHSARIQLHQQCYDRVDKKYRVLRRYGIDQTLTNAANHTAAQYALSFGLGDLATYINREPECA
ncbi:ankyrin repeat domain-containing protein [Aspergillus thermomutatus]|uniref:Uncharacterized protein n=1 Tax=Aspergillus thermomutatus TaxID=41047 RepID=A0A397G4N6_ASPTH|nr:uncharacterized protein CDV56_100866 [Aspergillus thermomutatus]RHZ43110.1 hypothetical protein CDV56_100866 [Aspergillus thermomutatus]